MNNQTRRQQQRKLREQQALPALGPAVIPPWRELAKLKAPAVQALAVRLGIPYTNRPQTLSAINQAR